MPIILSTEFPREVTDLRITGFHWQKSGCPSWSGLCQSCLSIFEWTKWHFYQWCPNFILNIMILLWLGYKKCKLYCSLSFKESCDLTIIGFHWQKSGCPSWSGLCQSFLSIFEWTKWHFYQWCPNFILNIMILLWLSYKKCKLYCSLSFKKSCDLTIIGFHWQKSGRPSLSGLCQSCLSIFEWTKWHFCQWCPNFIWNVWFLWGWVMEIILLTEFQRELWLNNNWLSLTKVRLSISEWAVPKLFIHLWVDKLALLSMMSRFYFKSMIPLRLGYANYIAHWVSKRVVT